MCVGFTNGYKDFPSWKVEEALKRAVPGSAVSFDRVGLFHFAIYLGMAWPKDSPDDPVPLVCHFSGDARTVPMASVRLDDFRDVVQNSTIRVYKCHCSADKRQRVITESLASVGQTGYNPVTNNCEHFVRRIINRSSFSYQSFWTFAAPIIQLPRLLIGAPIGGSLGSSVSACVASGLGKYRSLGLLDPEMNLIELVVTDKGLHLQSVKKNSCCTREYAGKNSHFPMQQLQHCHTCSLDKKEIVCKPCTLLCHETCDTQGTAQVSEELCNCTHALRTGGTMPIMRRKNAESRLQRSRIFQSAEYEPEDSIE